MINPPKSWQPKHCTHKKCPSHRQLPELWAFYELKPFWRKTDNRWVRRFRCKSCGGSFSSQTFSTTYWKKRPELDNAILSCAANGMANSQIARTVGCHPSTVDRKLEQMGRHSLLYLLYMRCLATPSQEIVYDGLETFEYSQFFPYHLNIAVDKSSDYILDFNESELRRKGAMTKKQKEKRIELEEKHGRPNGKAIEESTKEIFQTLITTQEYVTVYSDKHKQYLKPLVKFGDRITHHRISSKEPRDCKSKLFAVNRLDMMLRHGQKNHTRETIAFSKRRQAGMEKAAVFTVYMNFMMDRRQRSAKGWTPAMFMGLVDRKLCYEEVFAQRLFVFQFDMPQKWKEYYYRKVPTRALLRNKGHTLAYAC